MSLSSKDDDWLLGAFKWLGAFSALVLVAGAMIWLDMTSQKSGRRTPPASKVPDDNDDATSRGEDPIQAPRVSPPWRRSERDASLRESASHKTAEPAIDDEPTEAEVEASRYEENDRKFNERLALLESELEDGLAHEETDTALTERLAAVLGRDTRLPAQFETRCSQSVCELSFVGEGSALDFAVSAATGLSSVARGAARGPARDALRESFDPDQAIQPTGPAPEATEPDSAVPQPRVALRSIRYLVDVKDLNLAPPESPSPDGENLNSSRTSPYDRDLSD